MIINDYDNKVISLNDLLEICAEEFGKADEEHERITLEIFDEAKRRAKSE